MFTVKCGNIIPQCSVLHFLKKLCDLDPTYNCSSRVSCAVVNDCNKQQKVESHRPFQERGAIARTHPHTCANVFKHVINCTCK